jgi:DNA-binding response OmpR family regulator
MNATTTQKRIREALASLAFAHAQSVSHIEQAIESLAVLLEAPEIAPPSRRVDPNQPHTDRDTLSVVWKGQRCFLGNTLPFLLFEQLARTPNRYVPVSDLIDTVWGGRREASTIRGVVKRLRDQLRQAGMGPVADAIDGAATEHYRLTTV